MEDIIKDNIVDDDSGDDSNNNEDTGLREYLGQEVKMVEDDLENNSAEDHGGEHDWAGELFPFPCSKVDTSMITTIFMSMIMIMLTWVETLLSIMLASSMMCLLIQRETGLLIAQPSDIYLIKML